MDKETAMITLTVDGIEVSVPKGTTVYKAAEQLGTKIPIFCYQDRMPAFGACRVCLVEVEKFNKLQTSCTLEATEGMVVKTQAAKAIQGRQEIIELLLINHPLDCPICDRGGECPLQDNTMNDGPGKSVFVEDKRRFKKPLPLGSVLMLDRERCIACARCTRFGELIAGDSALVFKDRGYRMEVATPGGEPVASKFIGNTIKICPVGALTSQVYRFRARPWDNDVTETCCTLCPVGCSMYFDSRDGEIMRTRSCEDKRINDIWLCDKGWFGYQFTSSSERLQKPLIRKNGILEQVEWQEALDFASAHIQEARINGHTAALAGTALTTEEYFLFQKFARDSLATNHIDYRVGMPLYDLSDEGQGPGMEISIDECEELSTIIFLGIDLTEEFPVLWLRLKQAMNKGASTTFLGHYRPEITLHLENVVIHPPGEELASIKQYIPKLLKERKGKVAFFIGSGYLSLHNRKEILSQIASLKEEGISVNILEGRGNSMGARFSGFRSDLLPASSPHLVQGLNALQILEKGEQPGWHLLYMAGSNPAALYPNQWKRIRENTKFIIVQDLFMTKTAATADVVFPTLSYAEKHGSFINIAGNVQKMNPGKAIPPNLYTDAEIFGLLANNLGTPFEVSIRFMRTLEEAKISLPVLQDEIPASENALTDAPLNASNISEADLLGVFSHALFDRGERMKRNPALLEMVKDPVIRMHPQELASRNLADGDAVRIDANGISIMTKIQSDNGVALRCVVLPLGFEQFPFAELNPSMRNGFVLTIYKEG